MKYMSTKSTPIISMIICRNARQDIGAGRQSRKNNMQVDGVTEKKGETWDDYEKKVLEILRDKLEIKDVIIERAHRVKSYQNKKNNKGNASFRTIVCKLLK